MPTQAMYWQNTTSGSESAADSVEATAGGGRRRRPDTRQDGPDRPDRSRTVVNIDRSRTLVQQAPAPSDAGGAQCPLRGLSTPGAVLAGAVVGGVGSALFGRGLLVGGVVGAAVAGGASLWMQAQEGRAEAPYTSPQTSRET